MSRRGWRPTSDNPSRWIAGLIAFILGAVSVLGHAPLFFWPVTLICLGLFARHISGVPSFDKRLRAGFWLGWCFGLGYFIAGLYWISSALIVFGPETAPFAIPAVLGLCIGLALFWGVGGALYAWARPTGRSAALVFAAAFFVVEFLRGHILTGFPWNLQGYIFPAGNPLSQTAALIGVYGLSYLVLLGGGVLGHEVFTAAAKTWRHLKMTMAVGATLFAMMIYGGVRLSNANVEFVEGVNLRVIQTTTSQQDKMKPDKYIEVVQSLLDQTFGEVQGAEAQSEGRAGFSENLDDITHIVWPESAVPGLMLRDKGLMQVLQQQLRDGPVLLTNFQRVVDGPDKRRIFNSFASFDFRGSGPVMISDYYNKHKLVPFGEYVPFAGLLEKLGLGVLSTAIGSQTPGPKNVVTQLSGLPPVSVQICYEIIFPGFTPNPKTGVKPEWILNVSNDSWYGRSSGPLQHINQAQFRAIETGLPVVRSAASGVSAIIDPYGRFTQAGSFGEELALNGKLPKKISKVRLTWNIAWLLALINILFLIGCGYSAHRRLGALH